MWAGGKAPVLVVAAHGARGEEEDQAAHEVQEGVQRGGDDGQRAALHRSKHLAPPESKRNGASYHARTKSIRAEAGIFPSQHQYRVSRVDISTTAASKGEGAYTS